MDDFLIRLAGVLAWPFVALVGIIVLGPMGYLERIVKGVASTVSDLNSVVTDFREHTLHIPQVLDDLNKRAELIRADASRTAVELDEKFGSLGTIMVDLDKKVGSMLQQMAAGSEPEVHTLFSDKEEKPTTTAEKTSDEMMDDVRLKWRAFTGKLRAISKNPDDFDARMIGEEATRVARRRDNLISKELAEEIGALHSRYKRWMRLQGSKDEWLTNELHAAFVDAITAVQARLPHPPTPRRKPQ